MENHIKSTHILVGWKMHESKLNMYKNLLQLRKINGCQVVRKKRNSFSVEILIRDGRYKIRIDYHEKGFPEIYVVSPEIDMSSFLEIHTFGLKYHGDYNRELPKLCLTYYSIDKWNSSIMLSESYIPWAIEWTEFYEIWLLTGKWYGGGIHPESEKENE